MVKLHPFLVFRDAFFTIAVFNMSKMLGNIDQYRFPFSQSIRPGEFLSHPKTERNFQVSLNMYDEDAELP